VKKTAFIKKLFCGIALCVLSVFVLSACVISFPIPGPNPTPNPEPESCPYTRPEPDKPCVDNESYICGEAAVLKVRQLISQLPADHRHINMNNRVYYVNKLNEINSLTQTTGGFIW